MARKTAIGCPSCLFRAKPEANWGNHLWRHAKPGRAEKDTETLPINYEGQRAITILLTNQPVLSFSHSALREGWDSPNVFQICTAEPDHLRNQETTGNWAWCVRLAVNQEGKRGAWWKKLTCLLWLPMTVTANYVRQLQTEVQDEFGTANSTPQTQKCKGHVM